MNNLASYLPQDRRRALAQGRQLPDRVHGSALLADISGFTPFTEALRQTLGPRRGAEELSAQLDAVYTVLISEVERYGGSVATFAGDAITCWFDDTVADGPASLRATACAAALQTAMQSLAVIPLPNGETGRLTIKIGVATGPARRLTVGDESHYWLDVLAGKTVRRAAVAEQLATAPEIILDEATLCDLGEAITVGERRVRHQTGEQFGVLAALTAVITPPPLAPLPRLDEECLRPWINPLVYGRETTGHALLLTEFRPCVALFVRFTGIDYDSDTAEAELNQFVGHILQLAARYEGTLIDLTFGDKGSYAYLNFGALSAHEDDARRAVKTALELQTAAQKLGFLAPLQMGLTMGVMRTGAYGAPTRRNYGALGDDVNWAARLMQAAAPNEILLSGHIYQAVQSHFVGEARPPLVVKGKTKPISTFLLTNSQPALHLHEPTYALPMVGRQAEMAMIREKLDLAAAGRSQIVSLVGEAGIGKSRLAAAGVQLAREAGFIGYGGACQSDGRNTPYLVWKQIWLAFFGLNFDLSPTAQSNQLADEVARYAPQRLEALPLLGRLLGLPIPENEFTQMLEPKYRQTALHALLEDCLKAAAKGEPLLIVIEDLHWIDALSYDLLEQFAKTLANYPVCFMLACRPPQLARLEAPRLEALPQFTYIKLHELTPAEAESVIRAKMAQLYPARGEALPHGLAQTLIARAQGNPFYLEELLNYVRDRGLDPANIENIELPDSLHALILSRIDQLSEQEKTTLRVASIVGRQFRAKWLMGYCPELGTFQTVKTALDALAFLDITPLDSSAPERVYLFKHIVTHEVTYESLPFATRTQLHERLARYLENTYPEALPLEALAFHYGRSDNTAKQMEYLRKGGAAAQKNFANDAALDFYSKLLSLIQDDKQKFDAHLKRGQVYEFIGKYDEAESDYCAALAFTQDDRALKTSVQFALGKLSRLRGNYALALEWLGQAQEARAALKENDGLAQVLIEMGMILYHTGEYEQARELLNAGMGAAREAGDKISVADSLNNLGLVLLAQGGYAVARALFEESLSLRREISNKLGIANSLNNLGGVALAQGGYATAWALFEESLSLKREMGDKSGISALLNNLGFVALVQGHYATARTLHEESLSLRREMGDKRGIAESLNGLGGVTLAQGDYAAARVLFEESLSLRREISNKLGLAESLNGLGFVALAQGDYAAARALFEESLSLCRKMEEKTFMAYSLLGLGLVELAEDKSKADEYLLDSLYLRMETGEPLGQTSSLVGVAGVALQRGDSTGAAQWLGAVESALKVLDAAVEIEVKQFHAQTLATTRKALGAAAFQSACAVGAGWSLEEAALRALAGRGSVYALLARTDTET